jgi:hypothetical protein
MIYGSIKGVINLVVEFINQPVLVLRPGVVLRSLKKGIGFCLSPFGFIRKSILTFGELKTRPGSPLAVFFSFFDPGITFNKTGFLQRHSQIRISQDERFGNAVPYSPRLA